MVVVFIVIEDGTGTGLPPLWVLLSSANAWAAATVSNISNYK